VTEERVDDLLAELARVARDVGRAIRPVGHDEMLSAITAVARELFQAAACSIALLDDDGDELVFHVASGAGAEDVVGLRIPSSRGIAGWVVMSGQAIVIDDVTRDPRFARDFAASTGYVPRSILAMPLETDRRMLGVIEVLDRDPAAAGPRDLERLALFASQAALALEGARAFTDLGRELLTALAGATESGDLREALERAALQAPEEDADVDALAAMFAELGRAGAEERALAIRLVSAVLAFVRPYRARSS
jgi:GAF domain-containing protein